MVHSTTAPNGEDLSRTIIDLLSTVRETRPEELDPPLQEVIDLESLNRLFAGKATEGRVTFRYQGYEVTARSDGHVHLRQTNSD